MNYKCETVQRWFFFKFTALDDGLYIPGGLLRLPAALLEAIASSVSERRLHRHVLP